MQSWDNVLSLEFKRLSTAVGMSGAVAFVWLWLLLQLFIQVFILNPLGLAFCRLLAFILVWLPCSTGRDNFKKNKSCPLPRPLVSFLPLITTNCTILGVAILIIQKEFNLVEGVIFAVSNAIGYGMALTLFAGIREHLDMQNVPQGLKGTPIALITAAILSMAFMGFSGLV